MITESPVSIPSLQSAPDCADVIKELVNRAYDRAKRWAGAVIVLQTCLFVAGVVAIFVPVFTLSYPWIALPLALVASCISGQAARAKAMAERAKRQHEYLAGFGVAPSRGLLADLRVVLAKELPEATDRLLREGITYSSAKCAGAARALENLSESAWYTKHLAGWCASLLRAIFLGSVGIAAALLLLSATSLSGTPVGLGAARFVAATLIFLISIGTLRSWLAYAAMSQKAGEIDGEACRLLSHEPVDSFEAQRLLAEYQLARASGPLVPTWVWKLRRETLNNNWQLKRPQE